MTPSRPRSVGLRPTRCVVHLLRFAPPSDSLRLAISGFASGSVAPLGSFGFKLSLNAAELPKLDAEFEEITEGEEPTKKEKLKTKWAALEALVGDPKRIALVAADLVAHLTPSPPAQSGCAQRFALSVSLSPLAEFGSRSAWRRWTARQ
jgi:hypothetical protein